MIKVSIHALALALVVSGCSGRTSAPIAVTHAGDQDLSCSQVRAEVSRNEQQAQSLYDQHKKAGDANIAIGVVGVVLFWPALFALDTGTAEKDEARALEARNTHLNIILGRKNCIEAASNSTMPPPIAVVPRGTPRANSPAQATSPGVSPDPTPRSSVTPATTAGLASAPDVAARRLKSLDDMLVRKALTREEYDRKRLAILSGQ